MSETKKKGNWKEWCKKHKTTLVWGVPVMVGGFCTGYLIGQMLNNGIDRVFSRGFDNALAIVKADNPEAYQQLLDKGLIILKNSKEVIQ